MNRTPRPGAPPGGPTRAHARRRRRALVWAVAALAATVVLVAAVLIAIGAGGDSGRPPHRPAASAHRRAGPSTRDPPTGAPYRPAVHLTPAERWMNDPQRPFWLDGAWHYYYLYNADYPDGNGTEWYHATSTDLVHWREEGVAIEKYANGLGDIETGSAVVDTENTAGFGAGAVIAIMTQQDDGVQRQSLFVSTDGGYRFEPFDGNPVMDNPGAQHWRDPKIVWDDARRRVAHGARRGPQARLLHLARPEGLDLPLRLRARRPRHPRVPRPVPDVARRRPGEDHLGARRRRERRASTA